MHARSVFAQALAAAFMLAGAGCNRTAPPPVDAAADSLGAAASGAETFFRYGLVQTGGTRAALQAKLGDPDSITARPVQNRHDSTQTDSVLVAHYPGLAVEIYRVTNGGRELTSSVRITDNRYIEASSPIRIGLTQDDIANVMGPPTERTGETLVYACPTCTELGNERIEVTLADGRIAAITIFYSID
jgi:hypothetical protein